MRTHLIFTLVAVVAAASAVSGQSNLSTLSGQISDQSGGIVPEVEVVIINTESGESYRAQSSESGQYTIPLVKPGPYRLTARREGFKEYSQSGIVLLTGAQLRVDLKLELGAVSERIEVQASIPLLQSETSAVRGTVDNRTIANMPLINRRAAQLTKLNGFLVQTGETSFAIAGGRSDNAMWMIDGGSVQNVTLGNPNIRFDPPIESLQEFNVSIANYAAELGRTAGGVIQMTTRSGTNQFRGSVYEYFRNDALDARSFFAAQRATLRYNLFGASLGGPVRKDKTHFFVNYEGRRIAQQTTRLLNVPDPEETRGNFSASGAAVRDPAAAGRTPFPGNVIPASRLDPAGAKLASYYPAPNVPGRPSGSANFLRNQPVRLPNDSLVTRVDHIFTENSRVYGRFLYQKNQTQNLAVFPVEAADPFYQLFTDTYYNASGTWFQNLSPALVNEFRYTLTWRISPNRAGGYQSKEARDLAIPGVNPDFFPTVAVAGLTGMGLGGNHERNQNPIRDDQYVNHLSYVRGKHYIKGGYEFRPARNDDIIRNRAGGGFNFNNTATGNSLAALLLGWTQQATFDESLLIRSRANAQAFFVQDDWKITPGFSLNIGLRWDWDQPRWEQVDNRQNSFDRAAVNPVSGTPGIVTFSGRNGLSKFAHNHDWNNFAPRLGFAWRIKDLWVVRGGGAIVYLPEYDQPTPIVANLGFGVQGSFVSPDNGLTPALLLRNGIPSVKPPSEADLNAGFGAVRVGQNPNTAPTFFEPRRANGYLETFNLSVQRQLGKNMVFEAGYVGNLAHKIPAPSAQTINQVRPELMGPGNAQVRRPFPQFTNVQVIAASIGNSNYHAMNLRFEKRASGGLTVLGNYTWSRLIDDVESRGEIGGSAGSGFQNFYDRAADRGLSGNHILHRFVWSSVYDLPFGKGRPRSFRSPVLNQTLGNWSAGLIAEFRSGPPYGVIEQVNRTNAFSDSQRPNVAGDPVLPGGRSRAERVAQWFNTAAFAQAPEFAFGNAGRTNGYGPGAITADLSVLKDFSIRERHRLQFRTEMLNFMNRPNFGLPNLNRGNAAFGRITSASPGRVIQLGLHYKF